MTFEEAVAFLDERARFGMKPGLDRIGAICEALGDPQRSYEVVHVSGTNGKYSVAVMVSALLEQLGLTVGLYTSPHMESVCERFAIGGVPIDEERFADVVEHLVPYLELAEGRRSGELSYFELSTAIAFEAFFDQAVHAAVLECGLGGEWDATNVADARVAVVTSVGRDHLAQFGDDVRRIAWEKAGIVKADSAVVTGVAEPELQAVIEERAVERGASGVSRIGREFAVVDRSPGIGGQLLTVQGTRGTYDDVFVTAFGEAQASNAAVALAAVEAFTGSALDPDAVRAAFAGVRVPGRIEVAVREPLLVLDGGHNPDAISSVLGALRESFGPRRLVVVVGMLSDKLTDEVLGLLAEAGERFVVTASTDERAEDPEALSEALRSGGVAEGAVRIVRSVPEAVQAGMEEAGEQDLVLVTGSFTVVGEARAWLRAEGRLAHP